MQVHITGKNFDIGDSLRAQIEHRLSGDVAKYFDGTVTCTVAIEKERNGFSTDCTLYLSTGIALHTEARAPEAPTSFDRAADRIEKRLRRYKRRLKDHHSHRRVPVTSFSAPRYVLAGSVEEEPADAHDLAPPIVAEDMAQIHDLTVGEAVMQLDISDAPFVLFRNAAHGGLNVVYRRQDGNIGWIDPDPARSRPTA